jgi:hypothetical protein
MHRERSTHPARLGGAGRRWLVVSSLIGGLIGGTAVQAAPGLTVGAIVPQSWPNPTQGEEIILGMQLAIKTWPGQPTAKLIIKDSACKTPTADTAAAELVAARVDMVVGGFCAIGNLPRLVTEAGLPLVLANAQRLPKAPDGVLQLGRQEFYVADRLAATLRTQTGLTVSANTSCWMDFEPVLREQYDAILCPVLGVDPVRWQQAEGTFTAANMRAFTFSVARGYAAMEVALTQLKRLRSKSKSSEPIDTIFGPLPTDGTPPPPDAMQLVLSNKLPRMDPQELARLNQLIKTKSCTCSPGAACSQGTPWTNQPFVLRGNTPQCKVLSSAAAL